ncbi:MAG: phosphoglucosamine mutase [Methanosarcina thermophila]|jgi:phosphoglucosamine mutase|uniref:Probable phosphoglucosamine mutase n=3 Tax=Methanosarcina thermophila TaxID=2210 RepID=A0A1I7A3Y4_METTE|nr:phosphoglucosamine mutase [Methanosarcina thermophila]ALK05481.1 MAG: phosphoglucosamine mutase [Methanosarcina sp. 795]AKB14301.1 Phosphomannomutase [Methanosarcina thermophila TM-1]AKB15058.1 Phosphomannomutase [Methanosarcina thermophila CHTI-55]NLU58287.1 phosphoglucosamine mutase [Methanosarcina thermophila]SFT69595.1 phosphoglucosamine mutase [Methanosarcina thermophila]
MKLFGSSGIRGIANKEITPELALNVGLVLGSRKKTAVIGRDPRVSAQMIEHSLIAGMTAAGCAVTEIGLVTTPTLAYAAREYECGVMVTASHNPSEYVGIKLWNPDGMAFDSSQQDEIERAIEDANFSRVPWNRIGRFEEDGNAVRAHMNMIKKLVGSSSLKVVLDCGCGAGGTISPYLLQELGCEVITLNAQPDGHFPARNPEPNDENLSMLKKAVVDFGADLGIAHDGDADRMMAVDEKGNFVSGDELLAIFGHYECNGNKGTVVVPVDTSLMVDDFLKGSEIVRTRVGDVYVAEGIKQYGAIYGGEPSGSWIFPKISYCPDGIYAAAKLVEIVKEKKLSELREELPKYATKRGTLPCANEKKAEFMEKVKAKLEPLGKVLDIDGIRVEMDNGWVLVRPSGTEAKVRITAEARENVDEIFEMAEKIAKEALK